MMRHTLTRRIDGHRIVQIYVNLDAIECVEDDNDYCKIYLSSEVVDITEPSLN
jgi:hypothetical protein